LSSFRGDATFKTWLITIVRNEAIAFLRSQRRRHRVMPPTDAAVVARVAAVAPSPEDQVLAGERRRHLSRCVDGLPSRLRDALRLAHSGRHSYKEMGAVLGAPTGTIKSRVWEARQLVAGQMRSFVS
jgi:RNA polymerase sigma-70 factor, ECF subfamily